MVVSLSKRLDFSLLIQSTKMLTVPVHWFGRTLICPGAEICPACYCSRPKKYHYVAATVKKRLEVVELCDSLGRTFIELAATFPGCTLAGFWSYGKRANKRSIWDIEKIGYAPEHRVDVQDSVLIDEVSSLYQLPIGATSEPLATWFERIKRSHIPLLKNCVIA